jgi:hypothetical protein
MTNDTRRRKGHGRDETHEDVSAVLAGIGYEECRRDCAWFIEMSADRALLLHSRWCQYPDLPAAITVRRMVK